MMVCLRCNKLSSDSERCSKCGTSLKTLESQRLRGWIAFGAAGFLAVFIAVIWIWVNHLFAANDVTDPGALAFLGKVNVAFGLIVIAGIIGMFNGWLMARTGRRNTVLVVALLLCFVAALCIAGAASSAYHPAQGA
jgi:MFS family permease